MTNEPFEMLIFSNVSSILFFFLIIIQIFLRKLITLLKIPLCVLKISAPLDLPLKFDKMGTYNVPQESRW
jgi:hypothetical protein